MSAPKFKPPFIDPAALLDQLKKKAGEALTEALEKDAKVDLHDWSARLRNRPFSVFGLAHWIGEKVLVARGFTFERRRLGDLRIGVWKKEISSAARRQRLKAQGQVPRRVVVLPGFGDTPIGWMMIFGRLSRVLRARFDEILWIDYPGFSGFLAHHKSFHDVKLLRESVAETLSTLQPEVVVGHSLGGYLASYFAGTWGRRHAEANESASTLPVRGYQGPREVILLDPSGAFGSLEERDTLVARFSEATRLGFEKLRPYIFKKEPFLFKAGLKYFGAFIHREEIREFMASVEALKNDPAESGGVSPWLKDIRVPVWLLWGEHDSLLPPSQMEVWKKAMVQCQSVQGALILGVGHSPHVENPVVTARLLARILLHEPIRKDDRNFRLAL